MRTRGLPCQSAFSGSLFVLVVLCSCVGTNENRIAVGVVFRDTNESSNLQGILLKPTPIW
jgi:hypothetical protein